MSAPLTAESPLGALIDQMRELKDQRAKLSDADKVLKDEQERLREIIIDRLDAEQTTMSRGLRATATITETLVGNVVDREALTNYITENDALYLLQMRINNGAYRDLMDSGQEVPGVKPFKKRDLSVRSL